MRRKSNFSLGNAQLSRKMRTFVLKWSGGSDR